MEKSISTKCGSIKRYLNKNKQLTGELLLFAIDLIESSNFSDDELLKTISSKLSTGKGLDDYEYHIMVDVLLPHKKLGCDG